MSHDDKWPASGRNLLKTLLNRPERLRTAGRRRTAADTIPASASRIFAVTVAVTAV
jgi:hypothetical protein